MKKLLSVTLLTASLFGVVAPTFAQESDFCRYVGDVIYPFTCGYMRNNYQPNDFVTMGHIALDAVTIPRLLIPKYWAIYGVQKGLKEADNYLRGDYR
jgi:hypothetical protein